MAADLGAKLATFDAHADQAVTELVAWLTDHRDDLIALARGRHVEGHYRYGDSNFLEWDDGELLAQTAQEIADAIVYQSRTIYRRQDGYAQETLSGHPPFGVLSLFVKLVTFVRTPVQSRTPVRPREESEGGRCT